MHHGLGTKPSTGSIVSGEGKSQTTTEYAGQLRETFSFLKIVYTDREHFLGYEFY